MCARFSVAQTRSVDQGSGATSVCVCVAIVIVHTFILMVIHFFSSEWIVFVRMIVCV